MTTMTKSLSIAAMVLLVGGTFVAVLGAASPVGSTLGPLGVVTILTGCGCIVMSGFATMMVRRRALLVMYLGLVCTIVAVISWSIVAWESWQPGPATDDLALVLAGTSSIGVGVFLALGLLLHLPPINALVWTVTVLTSVSIVLTGVVATWWLLRQSTLVRANRGVGYDTYSRFGEQLSRWFGVLMVLVVFGVVLTLILRGARQFLGVAPLEADRLTFESVCPRCGESQALRTHGDSCGTCGLRITVTPA